MMQRLINLHLIWQQFRLPWLFRAYPMSDVMASQMTSHSKTHNNQSSAQWHDDFNLKKENVSHCWKWWRWTSCQRCDVQPVWSQSRTAKMPTVYRVWQQPHLTGILTAHPINHIEFTHSTAYIIIQKYQKCRELVDNLLVDNMTIITFWQNNKPHLPLQ